MTLTNVVFLKEGDMRVAPILWLAHDNMGDRKKERESKSRRRSETKFETRKQCGTTRAGSKGVNMFDFNLLSQRASHLHVQTT